MTYKIGDEVIIAFPSTKYAQQFKDEKGYITRFVEDEPYAFEVHLKHGSMGFADYELAPSVPSGTAVESDEVSHPSHYTWLPNGVEVIDVTELMNFNLGNVVKYVLRAGHKTNDPITDLRKAAWYINREIERLEASK
ncbi:DUF3310 domain-containing protein [[Kitasatospora] papulosa]|uniref:DUF3310 domain-containing protein n=1 Tax=[Kitasatospora] papulosa TaxID=1464011 RepID=UPI003716997A